MSNQAGGIAIGIVLATTLVSGAVAAPAAAADRLHAQIVNAFTDEGEDATGIGHKRKHVVGCYQAALFVDSDLRPCS
jgi:hypothetical protein